MKSKRKDKEILAPTVGLIVAFASLGGSWADTSFLDDYEMDEAAIVYQSDFEEPDALSQPGWRIEQGRASVVDEGFAGSCVRVEPSPEGKFGQVTLTLDPPPQLPVLFVDFRVKPVAFAEGPEEFADVAGSVTGAFRLVKKEREEPTAALYVLNGNGERRGDWLDTGVTFRLDEEGRPLDWMRLTFRQEFFRADSEGSQYRWDLWVDGRLVAVNLGYYDHANIDPGRVTLLGHRRIPLYMDSLVVSRENPLFEDENRNGLSDRYESIYKIRGRDSDQDGDNLTVIEEFVHGTNPVLSDTDRDGLSDGEELEAERDPLDSSDRSRVLARRFKGNVLIDGIFGEVAMDTMTVCRTNQISFRIDFDENYQGRAEIKIGKVEVYENLFSKIPATVFNPFFDFRDTDGTIHLISWTGGFATSGLIRVEGEIKYYGYYSGEYWESIYKSVWYNRYDCCDFCSTCLSSVDFSYRLGSLPFGDGEAKVALKKLDIGPEVFHRSSLKYIGPTDEASVRYSRTNHPLDGNRRSLDWVRTATQFTTFHDLPQGNGYQMNMYAIANVDGTQPVGDPFQTVTVYNPDPNGFDDVKTLRIVEDGERHAAKEYRVYQTDVGQVWELFEGGVNDFLVRPLRYERLTELHPESRQGNGDKQEYKSPRLPQKTVRRETGHWNEALGQLMTDEVVDTVKVRFPWGWNVVEEIADPEGVALSTRYGFRDPKEVDLDNLSRAQDGVQWIEHPDGAWEWYGYDGEGNVTRVVRPLGNAPRPEKLPSGLEGYRVELREVNGPGYRLRTSFYNDGVHERTVFEDWRDRPTQPVEGEQIFRKMVAYHEGATPDDPGNEVTVTVRDGMTNEIIRQEYPDGRVVTHEMASTGDERTKTTTYYLANGVPERQSIKVTHRGGTVLETKEVDLASGVVTAHRKVAQLDERFRPLLTINELTGKFSAKGYGCCGTLFETSEDGQTHLYERDALGRVVAEESGYRNPLEPGTRLSQALGRREYRLDGKGRQLGTLSLPNDGGVALEAAMTYNLAGQRESETSVKGLRTEWRTLMLPDGGKLQLTSLPKSGHDERHRITSQKYDVSGKLVETMTYASTEPFATKPDPRTVVRHQQYAEGYDANGRYTQVTDIASPFDRRVIRTYSDERGRQTEVIYAYGTNLAASERFDYNDDGQLIRHLDPDGATTRYAYNEKGERVLTAIDLKIEPNEAVDHIDYEVDRITRNTSTFVVNAEGVEVRRQKTEVFTENGPVVMSVQEQALDGSESATIRYGQRVTQRRLEEESPGQWSIVVTQPDGAYTVQNYNRGRLSRSTRYDVEGSAVSWIEQEYDDSGRVWKTTDSRTGTTTVHYDENGRQWKVSAPNPATGSSTEGTLDNYFHYDALGQLIRTTKPSGGEVHQVYNANGTLHGTHGYHTTDVSYRYNGRGERTHLITYFGPENKPASTRWAFNARGQLAFKQDAHGKRVHYTYTPGGKLKSRTWARGVATTYHYDADNHLDLRSIDYSDATPDVHFTYTRLGQKHTVEDAGGTTTYTYRAGNPTKLLSETSGTEPELKTLTYTEDDFGRASGFQIGTANDPDQDYAVGYGYDGVGRLANVHAQGYWFDYAYEPNSTTDRVKTLTAPFLKQTVYTYEPGRDALISVSNRVGFQLTEEISRFTYTNNKDGQRIARETLREDDEGYVDRFLYDPDTGGVIASERYGVDEAYAYDKIGNRLRAEANGSERLYTPNALNQYERAGEHRPSHDVDGNLIAQGERTFTWDGENRLIAIHERGSFVATYTYDHQSRRIARRTRDGVDERYLYQGWNLIAVYAPGGVQPTETFTWGKDLSGSLQGAGGVGGLLFAKKRDADQDVWLYHYDANGNVTEVTDSLGAVLDSLTYDSFGNLTSVPQLLKNRWRFSTKPYDFESGFYYYGFRYYDPETGRWLSRDPIEEQGGLNLYAFVRNNGVNRIDYLGLLDDGEEFPDVQIRKKHIKWMVVKGKAVGDGYGHWWFEIDGSESYGWWPDRKVGAWDTLRGVPGDLNGELGNFGGTPTTDAHHGNAADEEYAATIDYGGFLGFNIQELEHGSGKGTKCDCAKPGEIKDCLREFAGSFAGGWSHPWGNSCRDFLAEAMDACCLND